MKDTSEMICSSIKWLSTNGERQRLKYMKVLIIQISDIHLKDQENVASERLKHVAKAVANVEVDLKAAIIVLSGDIAYSGNAQEYAIAKHNLLALKLDLASKLRDVPVYLVGVPGNHDCDFGVEKSARSILIDTIAKEPARNYDEDALSQCTDVQTKFFDLLNEIQCPPRMRSVAEAYYEFEVSVGNASILLRCYNTAMGSTIREKPGSLALPHSFLGSNEPGKSYDYIVSVFHHPYNWLSHHYLVGLPQTHLSAFGIKARARNGCPLRRRTTVWAGVVADSGAMNQEPLITIGERHGWGDPQLFGISQVDARQHIYVLGKTGSGKTTLLRNLILQHILLGHGVGVIDPHGDLAEELLDNIPPERADHVVYFNPGDIEFPIGLNFLANVPSDDRHLVASGIVSAFKGIWRDSWGPRMEYILYNAVSALLDCRNATLLGVNRMLTDDTFRARVIRQVKDPFIRSFWADEFESYDERFKREAIAPIQNKVGQFLLNPIIRNILGQVKTKVNIPFTMDQGRIFIANLSKGRLGHDKANLIGSLLVTQFQLGAMARATRPEEERRDFHLFIDEFQNFTTDAFASILAEARKYRLCLTLSHQYIDQLPLPIRQAVFGNVGTLISFRIGNADAEVIEREFGKTFTASALADLGRYEAVVKLLENGNNREPFRALMLPPLGEQFGRKNKLITLSRQKYAKARAMIADKISRWMQSSPHIIQDDAA